MPISLDPKRDALGVIDVQPAFMPGGTLPTPDGESVLAPINRLLAAPFRFRFATQDWHSGRNVTFASQHPGRRPLERLETEHGPRTLWPDHAIGGTPEAELHRLLDSAALDMVLRKGNVVELEGYSAFSDLEGRWRTGLAPMLRQRGVTRLFLAGLALDVCVAATAADAAGEGFETFVVEDACRAADPDGLPELKGRLAASGVLFVQERELGLPPRP